MHPGGITSPNSVKKYLLNFGTNFGLVELPDVLLVELLLFSISGSFQSINVCSRMADFLLKEEMVKARKAIQGNNPNFNVAHLGIGLFLRLPTR